MDTSTVTVSTMKIDSVDTSGKEVILLGQYKHPLWGMLKSSTYITYSVPGYSTDIDKIVVVDSVTLVLDYTGSYVGDTMSYQTYHVHQLTEKITLNDYGYLYSHSTVAYDPQPVGSITFRPRPLGAEDKLEIILSNEIGEDLLERFHYRDLSVSSDRFEDVFKGLIVIPDAEQTDCMLSFSVTDATGTMVIYYHSIEDGEDTPYELTFTPDATRQFNHIDHIREGSLLEQFNETITEFPSEQIGNRGFGMCGIGYYTNLQIPYLNNLALQGEQVEIEQAVLKIYPEPGTYSDFNELTGDIYLYIVDENNVVTNAVTDYLGTQVQSGTLVKDEVFLENTYIYFDVSTFIKEELGATGVYKHALRVVFGDEDYTTTIKNLTISDQYGQSPVVLEILYSIYGSY
ncbi:MAG: DUF4270 domain-containing protein [Tannerellaceae bacterium]|nr:DUF4270 domain-containing protein [Tannerellaceae bacterium]